MEDQLWTGFRLEMAMMAVAAAWAITMAIIYWQHCRRNNCLPPEDNKSKMVYWSSGYFVSICIMVVISFLSHVLV